MTAFEDRTRPMRWRGWLTLGMLLGAFAMVSAGQAFAPAHAAAKIADCTYDNTCGDSSGGDTGDTGDTGDNGPVAPTGGSGPQSPSGGATTAGSGDLPGDPDVGGGYVSDNPGDATSPGPRNDGSDDPSSPNGDPANSAPDPDPSVHGETDDTEAIRDGMWHAIWGPTSPMPGVDPGNDPFVDPFDSSKGPDTQDPIRDVIGPSNPVCETVQDLREHPGYCLAGLPPVVDSTPPMPPAPSVKLRTTAKAAPKVTTSSRPVVPVHGSKAKQHAAKKPAKKKQAKSHKG